MPGLKGRKMKPLTCACAYMGFAEIGGVRFQGLV